MASEAGGDDLYAVLGVGRDASEEDIRRAYRSLAQAVHPDKHAGAALREVANAHFSRLHAAYEVLRRVRVGRSQATRPLAQLPFPFASQHAPCVTPPALPSHHRSSPNQRAVYDVYGTDGLRAGLELGPALRSREELRAELQARAAAAKARDAEARVNYRATYVFGAFLWPRATRQRGWCSLWELFARRGEGAATRGHTTWRRPPLCVWHGFNATPQPN